MDEWAFKYVVKLCRKKGLHKCCPLISGFSGWICWVKAGKASKAEHGADGKQPLLGLTQQSYPDVTQRTCLWRRTPDVLTELSVAASLLVVFRRWSGKESSFPAKTETWYPAPTDSRIVALPSVTCADRDSGRDGKAGVGEKFTALMPVLVSSERSCCLWLVQSKYFYSSVVLENDVYSSAGDGSQPRLNTVFLIVVFFCFTVSRLCVFCSFFL